MKLIDFLISKGRSGWYWPNGMVKATCNVGSSAVNFYLDYSCPPTLSEMLIATCHFDEPGCISREQYEAALAACKPEWDGEGLPPVGTEAEVSVDGGRTWCLYKATSEHNGMRLVEIGDFTEEFQSNNWMFRPIRSEADKKRENLAKALHIAAGAEPIEVVGIGPLYLELADKILAGEVAGIRID